MRTNLFITLSLLLGTASALAPFQLSEPLGHEWNTYPTNFTSTWTKPFMITKNFLTGFSSGSMASSNILRLSPENYDGFGLLAGMLWKEFSTQTPWNLDELDLPDLVGKKVFTYFGSAEADEEYWQLKQYKGLEKFYRDGGADVTSQFIHDFHHVFPSRLPVNEEYHPENTCFASEDNIGETFKPPTKSWFRNCGYNLAYYMLQAFNPEEELKEQEDDHTKLGDFHAFNQTPFTDGNLTNAKMAEVGYIYIPHACKEGAHCQTVMFLHGCWQSALWWNDTEARRTGLIEHAATNNLIVVFPQNDDLLMMEDPKGKADPYPFQYCWSTLQTDDKDYPQIATLENIFHSLVLGTEDTEMMAKTLSREEVSMLALEQKADNVRIEYIEKVLATAKIDQQQVLQI